MNSTFAPGKIIDINKLAENEGDKTAAVEHFEGNNLVLVDEGHRGAGTAAGAWMNRREVLCRGGFAFEYSATFGQAVAKGFTVEKAEEDAKKKKARLLYGSTSLRKLDDEQLRQLALTSDETRKARTLAIREVYAKNILFDYSYKFFYDYGYGNESLILYLAVQDFKLQRSMSNLRLDRIRLEAFCKSGNSWYTLHIPAAELEIRSMTDIHKQEDILIRLLQDYTERFYNSSAGKAAIGSRSLYLLRNADTKAKGLGFALAGNFYPDFLLWLVDDATGMQWLSFVDPKGIRQMNLNDPKLGLYREVKVLQEKLTDPNLILNAFILAPTAYTDLLNVTCTEQELEERNLLFMKEAGQSRYLESMFGRMV